MNAYLSPFRHINPSLSESTVTSRLLRFRDSVLRGPESGTGKREEIGVNEGTIIRKGQGPDIYGGYDY